MPPAAPPPQRSSIPNQHAMGVILGGLVQMAVWVFLFVQPLRREDRPIGAFDVGFGAILVVLLGLYLSPWSSLALRALDPSRFPRLSSVAPMPHTPALDRAVDEVRALGFEVIGVLVIATPFYRRVSPALYSRQQGAFACVERVFGVPLVVFMSGGDTGPLLQTERRSTEPVRFGELVRQGTSASISERLRMHVTLAGQLGIAPPPTDASVADLLALQQRLERRFNVELYRGASGKVESLMRGRDGV